jgi:hypothetical protein
VVGVGVAVAVVVVVVVAVVVAVAVGVVVAVVVGVGVGVAVAVAVGVVITFNLTGEKMLNIDELTVKEIKHIQSLLKNSGEQTSPYQVGKNYYIRTVTHHQTGTLVRVTAKELVLKNAAWIADSGRFMQALKDGTLNEVEPFPDNAEVIVGRGAVIDATEWLHALPRQQK